MKSPDVRSLAFRRHHDVLACVAAVAVCMVGFLGGCASQGLTDAGLTSTSQGLAVPHFEPPFDPAMGKVVILVPVVDVATPDAACLGDLGETVRAQLISTLASSPNIEVADRRVMAEIAAEQRLNQTNATVNQNRPAMGQLAAVRYLVKATVTEFKESVQGHSTAGQVQLGPLLGIAGSFAGGSAGRVLHAIAAANPTIGHGEDNIEGVVGLELQVIDIQTGLVIGQTRALGKLNARNSSTVLGIAGISATDSRFQSSVLGQASLAAAEDATRQIHTLLRAHCTPLAKQSLQTTSVSVSPQLAAESAR